MQSKKYHFYKGVPALSLLLGLPATGLFLWFGADPTIFSNADLADDPVMRWLANQPVILFRLFFLAMAAVVFDAVVLTPLVPYLRSRVAVEFTAVHLVINAKYGLMRLPRDAIVDADREYSYSLTVVIQVKDAFKLRSWYGWRVNPTVQTGSIASLGVSEFLTQLKSWM